MKTPIVDLINGKVPKLLAWCTPSILPDKPQINNIYTSGMSISYQKPGSPEEPPWSEKSGIFGEAYRLAAEAYWGAAYDPEICHCLFSVNGSTGSNFAVLKALKLQLGDDMHILADRNLHKSVTDAGEDYRIPITFLEPSYPDSIQIFVPNPIQKYIDALKADPSINVVFISNPTYDGFSIDLKRLVAQIRAVREDIIIYVDEAWASAFYFAGGLQPPTALESGADISVISTHKQGGTLQQTGVILWRDKAGMIARQHMFYGYRSLFTTSPSWHMLASIDSARAYMHKYGEALIASRIAIGDYLTDKLRGVVPRITDADVRAAGAPDVIGMDGTKVLLDTGSVGVVGSRLAHQLEARDIVVEKSGQRTLLLLVPFQRTMNDAIATATIIGDLIDELGGGTLPAPLQTPTRFNKLKEPWQVKKTMPIPLKDSVGRVCGENIVPYPPGVPLVMKGEEIQQEHLDYIDELVSIGEIVLMYDDEVECVLVEA